VLALRPAGEGFTPTPAVLRPLRAEPVLRTRLGHADCKERKHTLTAIVVPFGTLVPLLKKEEDAVLGSITHPRPPTLTGWAKGVPRLPRLGFPPWNPTSEAPPPTKGIPKGGHPSRPRPVMNASLRSGAVVALGEDRATHGSGSPFGARPLQIHAAGVPVAPSRGLPAVREAWLARRFTRHAHFAVGAWAVYVKFFKC